MRLRYIVVIVLIVIVAAVITRSLLHKPAASSRISETASPNPESENRLPSTESSAKAGEPRLYPDPFQTPGATNPSVNQANIYETICVPGWTKTVRPPSHVTQRIKRRMMANVPGSSADYELDHLIPLELGGCPDCIENLWLEPYAPEPGARQKDEVENYLHKEVCGGSISLDEAQREITADWYKVYLEIHVHAGQNE